MAANTAQLIKVAETDPPSLGSGIVTPEQWQETNPIAPAEMEKLMTRLEQVARKGHRPTLPRPREPPLRRTGLWRNPFTRPESNENSIDLDRRHELARRNDPAAWHPKHGAPDVDRKPLDEASTTLRALHRTMPLVRVTKPTLLSQSGDRFARRYGAKLAKRLQKAGALSKDGVLLCKKGAPVLRTWLLEMASYKKGSDNAFQWKGFWITEEEATGLCESALEQAALA